MSNNGAFETPCFHAASKTCALVSDGKDRLKPTRYRNIEAYQDKRKKKFYICSIKLFIDVFNIL
jgi:hypothetical protein